MQYIPAQKSLQELIEYSSGDFRILLNTESFMRQIREKQPESIKYIVSNVKALLDILFIDYDKVNIEQFNIYSELNTRIWEIIDLEIEPFLKQIEIYWEIVFDLRWRALVPDVQWSAAFKIFHIMKERNQQFVVDQFSRPNFLVSFLPLFAINSVAQIIVIFYEVGFHQQQIDLLNLGVNKFQDFDPCTAINFAFLCHEIMTRILQQEQVEFLMQGTILTKMFQLVLSNNIDGIVLKNAAHILSLISNYFSAEMQNIRLDDPETQDITQQFRKSQFFEFFDENIIATIFKRSLEKNKIDLLTIKLVEIIDNLVRITDVKLWEKIDQANIMNLIMDLVTKFNKSDIFISYVVNMLQFIFERALSDFHPYWTTQLIVIYKIHERHIKQIDRQIYDFDQRLNLKMVQEGEFAIYSDYLKKIEEELMISHIWRNSKLLLMKQEEKNQIKLGDDLNSPVGEGPFIVSALNVEDGSSDGIQEDSANNIFIMCHSQPNEKNSVSLPQLTQNIFETVPITSIESESDNESENLSDKPIDLRQNVFEIKKEPIQINNLDALKNMFQKMENEDPTYGKQNKLSQSDSLGQISKKNQRNLSNSLNSIGSDKEIKHLSSSLKHEHEATSPNHIIRHNSLQNPTNIKKLNKNFDEYQIDVLGNRKILKNENNSVLRVDEIDFDKEQLDVQPLGMKIYFKKNDKELSLTSQLAQHQIQQVERIEDIKFKKASPKDLQFLEHLKQI